MSITPLLSSNSGLHTTPEICSSVRSRQLYSRTGHPLSIFDYHGSCEASVAEEVAEKGWHQAPDSSNESNYPLEHIARRMRLQGHEPNHRSLILPLP